MLDPLTTTLATTSAMCAGGILLIAAVVAGLLAVTGRGRRRSLQGALWLGAGPLLAPAVVMVIGIGLASIAVPILLGGATTTGVIVDNLLVMDGSGDPVFVAEVEYSTEAGERIRFEDPLAANNPPQYGVGQTVVVVYQPQAPERALIFEPSIWIVPLVLLALAALLWVIGVVIGWYKFRNTRAHN
jgi:hypothetical protein